MAKSKTKRGKSRSHAKRPTARTHARRGPKKLAPQLTRAEVDAALAKQLAKQKVKSSRSKALEPRLVDALERAQIEAAKLGFASALRVVRPPQRAVREGSWTTPWAVVARFQWKTTIGYDELYDILERWSGSRVTRDDREINKQRIARIKVAYVDSGNREEYTLAESAPWALCLARAMDECDPTDTETVRRGGMVGSLASRYGLVRDSNGNLIRGSVVSATYVWLSLDLSNNIFKRLQRKVN